MSIKNHSISEMDKLPAEIRLRLAREWLRSMGLDDWGNPSPPLSNPSPEGKNTPPEGEKGFIRWFLTGQGRALDFIRGVLVALLIFMVATWMVFYGQ